jgi:putative toxin-antitoxin system antitoxin component (TIGR02293 family)
MADRRHTTGKAAKVSKARRAGQPMHEHSEHPSGGNLATPIAVAVGAMVLGKMFGAEAEGVGASEPAQPVSAGSILAGLTDLIGKLSEGGVAPQVNSWVGHGPNEPVPPEQLGSALGQNVLEELSQRTGMSQQELLNQLSTVLPQIINHMTPDGRMPTLVDTKLSGKVAIVTGASKGIGAAVAKSLAASGVSVVGNYASIKETGYLEDVSTLLGGRPILGPAIQSELDAHELLHRGLPRAALSSLVDKIHFITSDEASEAIGMSLRTLQRHKSEPDALLDVQQSGRAWKFAEILAKATHVFGSQDEAEQWLRRPAIGLDQKRPIDLLTTPAGVQLVEDYLGRLEYNVYT